MSWRLVREVFERAPKLDPTAMLVLVCLAEHADDHTRRSWPGMDVMCAETRIEKPDTIQKALRRIRAAGVDLSQTTAHHGRRTVYTLPRWAEPHPSIAALADADGRNEVRPSTAERAEPVPRWAEPHPAMGGTSSAPSVRNRQEPGEREPGRDSPAYPEQCSRHQFGPNVAPCGACGDARRAHRKTDDRHRQTRADAHAARVAAVAACNECDEGGWLKAHDGALVQPATRCTHQRKAA